MPSATAREDRQRCWESRDIYYACLDKAGVVTPGTEGKACKAENKAYTTNCAKSWVDYFNQRRVIAEQQKDVLAAARKQMEEAQTAAANARR